MDRILRVCGDLDIPELGPDSPDLGVRILREYIWILRIFCLESHTGQTGLTGASRAERVKSGFNLLVKIDRN